MPTAARAYLYLRDADRAAEEEFDLEIKQLKELGIAAVVTLTEEPLAADKIREAGLDYLHLPVPDMTAPTPSQIREYIDFCTTHLTSDEAVVTHCLGGSGRTGTMLACYLVHQGMSAREAIRRVRSIRPSAIETHWQEEAIEMFELEMRNP